MLGGFNGLLIFKSHPDARRYGHIGTVRGPVCASTTWGGGIVEWVERLSIWIRGWIGILRTWNPTPGLGKWETVDVIWGIVGMGIRRNFWGGDEPMGIV